MRLDHGSTAEDADVLAALGTGEAAHVLDDAEHREVHLAAEHHTPADVLNGDLLRGRDHHGTVGLLDELGHREWLVPRPRRRIHHQVVEITPLDVPEKLLDHAVLSRAAPDDRIIALPKKEADRHDADHSGAVADLHGIQGVLATGDGRTLDMQELGNTRPMNVDIEQAHALSGHGQCCGQIDRHGALADAAFAGKHQDLVSDVRHSRLQRLAFEEVLLALISSLFLDRGFGHHVFSFFVPTGLLQTYTPRVSSSV
jgi:hypothetical protein